MRFLRFSLLFILFVLLSGCGTATENETFKPAEGQIAKESPSKNSDKTSSQQKDDKTPQKYSYIPTKITKKEAVRFLNKATFGATDEEIELLQTNGVVKWLEDQLSILPQKDIYLTTMIKLAKQAEPQYNTYGIKEYLEQNDKVFNKDRASFHSPRFFTSSWFSNALLAKDQVRHKMAYALSQIVVESDFEPIFTRRAEALARYFDILYINALGSYKKLIEEISFNSGMSMFLTFNGNKKLYINSASVPVYPDENYAREIMQLFTMGLNKLNLDGTPLKDAKGELIPTYTQKDVNELARVFTGWDIRLNGNNKKGFGKVGFTKGDLTHPVEFTEKYHDFGEKEFLGDKIEADLEGDKDILRAIEIIFKQQSVAPYIAKNLILRIAKSNPSSSYIKRVASALLSSDFDLKETVKAVLLDEELWNDIKENRVVKFKEPLVAYTNFLRAMNARAMPKWYFCGYGGPVDDNAGNCEIVKESLFFNKPVDYLGQGAGYAPTVFNFYDNDYTPNDDLFKEENLVAPELQIQSDTVIIKYSNKIREDLLHWERGYLLQHHYKKDDKWIKYDSLQEYISDAPKSNNIPLYYVGSDKMLLDLQDAYDVMEKIIDGDTDGDFEKLQDFRVKEYEDDEKALKALIDYEDLKLTGGSLTTEEKEAVFNALKDKIYNIYEDYDPKQAKNWAPRSKKYQLYERVIVPVIRAIVTSDAFMTE